MRLWLLFFCFNAIYAETCFADEVPAAHTATHTADQTTAATIVHSGETSKEDLWRRLIYYHHGRFQILTPEFLLSYSSPSPEREKQLTIEAFRSNPQTICKFPARYSYLLETGAIDPISASCPELDEYRTKVLIDSFKYVFASKNLESATSMMGHGFIAAEGVDEVGITRRHGFSFLADLRGQNLLTAFFEAFITGLDSVFALRPLDTDIDQYIYLEGREVWVLELDLSLEDRIRLRDALWELKDANPTYFFQSFNCATQAFYTLAIVFPDIFQHEKMFVTPADIYRALQAQGHVSFIDLKISENAVASVAESGRSGPYSVVQPSAEIQDSNIGIYYNGDTHVTFLSASHHFETPQVASQYQTALKIGEIDFNLSRQSVEKFTIYEVLDISENAFLGSHIFVGFSNGDYTDLDARIPAVLYTMGPNIQLGATTSLSFLAGLRSQKGHLINFVGEHFLSHKFSDFSTFTLSYGNSFIARNAYQHVKTSLNHRFLEDYVLSIGFEAHKNEVAKDERYFVSLNVHF